MNNVQLIGNVGSEPKLFQTTNGKECISFTLATTEKYNDTETTTWHNIKGWGYLAKKPIQKGQRLYISGKISNTSYEDKNGQTKYVSEVVALTIEVIQKLAKVEPLPEMKTPAQQAFDETPIRDGSLPF